jgi:hypothetical protein
VGADFSTTGTNQQVTGVRWFVRFDPTLRGNGPPTTPNPFNYTVYLYQNTTPGATPLATADATVSPAINGDFVTTTFDTAVPIQPKTTYRVVAYHPGSAAFYPESTTAGVTTACGITLLQSYTSIGDAVPPTYSSSVFYGLEPVVETIPSGTE